MLFYSYGITNKKSWYNKVNAQTTISVQSQEKSNEKARQELLKKNEALTKALNDSKDQLEQMREVRLQNIHKRVCIQHFNASWSVSTWQAEKRLKVQLTSVEQQQLNTQEVLKEKQSQLEKLQAQLKTVQGNFEVETKKLKGQIAELQENGVKMVSWNLKWIHS